jgi:sugar phosphate permease
MVDVGAILGSIALGYISDLMHGKRSPVALVAVIAAIGLCFTLTFNVYSLALNSPFLLLIVMFFVGFFISGLNNLISSACAADLGK